MPEGAEVRIIAEGLRSELELTKITSIDVLSGRYVRHDTPKLFDSFKASLPLVCDNVCVKGKFIYLTFRNGWSMWNTMGMTGCWLREKTQYARMSITYHSIMPPYKGGTLYFDDVRNFGTVRFSSDRAELMKKLKTFGIDLLNERHHPNDTLKVLSAKRNVGRTMVEVLMDQRCFPGIGNYVKAEVLYRSGLSPHRKCGTLTKEEVLCLHDKTIEVLHGSYRAGGVTLSDYRDIDGNEGVFERLVYGKDQDPLGNPVIKEETLDKRVTHWVPAVQR